MIRRAKWAGLRSTVLFVVPVRAVLGIWGLTITQANPTGINGFGESLFLGMVGATIWAYTISTAVLTWWFGYEGRPSFRAAHAPLRCGAAGAAGGFTGGLIISLLLLFVYGATPLSNMNWIEKSLGDAFTKTGMGYGMPCSGALVGMGAGFLTARLASTWSAKGGRTLRVWGGMILTILLPMAAGALLFNWLVAPDKPRMMARLLGDYCNVAFGGVGLATGLLGALAKPVEAARTGI